MNTKNRFIGKTRCIIEQYNNYTAESVNLPLNGINTQGENIADNGGLKETYRAYSKYLILLIGDAKILYELEYNDCKEIACASYNITHL